MSLQHLWSVGGQAVGALHDGTVVITSPYSIRFLNTNTGASSYIENIEGPVGTTAVCQTTGWVAYSSGHVNPAITVYDVAKRRQVAVLQADDESCSQYQQIAISHDGKHLAAVSDLPSFQLTIWSIVTGAIVVQSFDKLVDVTGLSFCPKNSDLLVAFLPGATHIFTIETCRSIKAIQPKIIRFTPEKVNHQHSERRGSIVDRLSMTVEVKTIVKSHQTSLAWQPDGNRIFFGCNDGSVRVVDLELSVEETCVGKRAYGHDSATGLAVLADHSLILGSSNGVLRVLSSEFRQVREMVLKDALNGLQWIHIGDNNSAVIVTKESIIAVDLSSMPNLQDSLRVTAKLHVAQVVAVGTVRLMDTECIVSVDLSGLILVHGNTGSFVSSARCKSQDPVSIMASTPGGNLVAIANAVGQIELFALDAKGVRSVSVETPLRDSKVLAMAFNQAGRYLFVIFHQSDLVLVLDTHFHLRKVGQFTSSGPTKALATVPRFADGATELFITSSTGEQSGAMTTAVIPKSITTNLYTQHANPVYSLNEHHISRRSYQISVQASSVVPVPHVTGKFVGQVGSNVVRFQLDDNRLQDVDSVGARAISGMPRIVVSNSGSVVAAFGSDGSLNVRYSSQEHFHSSASCFAHAHELGGIADVTFLQGAHRLVTAGRDGVVNAWRFGSDDMAQAKNVSQGEHALNESLVASFAPLPAKFMSSIAMSLDVVHQASSAENTQPQTAAQPVAYTDEQLQIKRKIEDLRTRLLGMIDANDKKPEEEKLAREEYVLDLFERDRLIAQADREQEQLKEDIEFQILEQKFLFDTLKRECWDSMAVNGKTLYSFLSSLEVSNFPLRKRSTAEMKELTRVAMLRKIEKAEARIVRELLDSSDRRSTTVSLALEPSIPSIRVEDRSVTAAAASAAPIAASASAEGEAKEGDQTTNPSAASQHMRSSSHVRDYDEDDDSLMYEPIALTSSLRKRNQVILIHDTIYNLKKKFNEEFEEVHQYKKDEVAKIRERNQRIQKILNELKITEDLFHPKSHLLEHPEDILVVRDDEVTVERVLTAAEKAAKEEAARKEAERLAAEQQDNVRERGVKDMMNNRLEGKSEEDIWIDPPKPDFMTQLAPENWNEDHKRIAAEFKKKEDELADLRDKRRKALDAERTKLHEQIQAGCEAFDHRLKTLFKTKIETEQSVNVLEVTMMKLALALQADEDSLAKENAARQEAEIHRVLRGSAQELVMDTREVVAKIQAEYEALAAEDKALEKSFKQRKEFAEYEQYLDALFKLYKRRSKKVTAHSDASNQLTKDDCPEGLDSLLWKKFLDLREQKIAFEGVVKAKAAELAEATTFLQHRVAEEEYHASRVEEANKIIKAMQDERVREANDLDVIVRIEQGQVEILHEDAFDPVYDTALLLHDSVVHDLNSQTKKLGQAKVAHVKEKMERMRTVRVLEWDLKRLDMEAEDLKAKLKEIQMLRVKRSPEETDDERTTIDKLNRTIAAQKAAGDKEKAERTRALNQVERQITERSRSNDTLSFTITDLAADVSERATLHKVHLQNFGDGGQQERLKKLANRGKLLDLVKGQGDELNVLREELERLRMKTFPAFTV